MIFSAWRRELPNPTQDRCYWVIQKRGNDERPVELGLRLSREIYTSQLSTQLHLLAIVLMRRKPKLSSGLMLLLITRRTKLSTTSTVATDAILIAVYLMT